MKVINLKNTPKKYLEKPLFTGKVIRQSPVTGDEGSQLNIDYIYFPKGVRNKFHAHSNDQVLIVLDGQGIVATRKQKVFLKKGDIVWVPAGEEHWHGAVSGSKLAHISVTKAQTKLTQIEK